MDDSHKTDDQPFRAVATDDGYMLPIDKIIVTSIVDGEHVNTILAGSHIAAVPQHDIAKGTVTVAILNVETVEVQYKHNRRKQP